MPNVSIDLDRVRAETRGCGDVIYLNNAGASLMPDPVVDTVHEHLELEREVGAYEAVEQQAALRQRRNMSATIWLSSTCRNVAEL